MVEIERCKYLLPCSYCDKYDIPCKASKESLANYYNIPIANIPATEETTEDTENICNHNWRYKSTIMNPDGCVECYLCDRCGEIKVMPIEAL